VVVNETSEFLDELVQQCRLKAVQFHGDEEAGTLAPGGVATWRAVKLLDGKWTPEPLMAKADRYVMDAAAAGYGGSGVTIDWAAAGEFAGKYPAMLAGGLVPGNVADAITKVRPLGVDVASGVEQSPGRKDPVKVKEFIQVAQLGFRVVEKEGRGLR
jgi:phosphoribosylanthranilate isomerase